MARSHYLRRAVSSISVSSVASVRRLFVKQLRPQLGGFVTVCKLDIYCLHLSDYVLVIETSVLEGAYYFR